MPSYAFDVPSIDTQKFPVEIYGDYLEYRTKAEQIVTKGKAYISYQDMKIAPKIFRQTLQLKTFSPRETLISGRVTTRQPAIFWFTT